MIFKKCCFFLPLNYGCYIIGALYLSYYVGELITHTNDTIFIKNLYPKTWGHVIMPPVLTVGTLVSVLLIIGAAKRKRGFILLWLISNIVIIVVFIILYIVSFIKFSPPPIIITVQTVIIGLVYSLVIVHSFYRYLSTVDNDDVI